MLDAALSGLVTGWAIAVPIGAVGVLLVSVTARTSWRVGASAALGIATVDGAYATVAVLGGAAAAALLAPVAEPLRLVSAAVLLVIAALTAWHAVARAQRGPAPGRTPTLGPGRAYGLFLGLTAVNPTTVVYFAAIVLANRALVAGPAEATVFVVAAFAASASWQLALAGGGAGLGRALTTPRGRLATGLVSAAVIAGLAVHTVLR
ncbi:LysE family transporter [Nocardioides sp. GCM10027113]|uniref:LysE family transporter n=1 Tax=unclassified Nocardioides TaxID=2615069 RepID=UPI003618515F